MEKNRKQLYVKLVKDEAITDPDFKYDDFIGYYFKDEKSIVNLWDTLKKDSRITEDKNSFFKKYACDLLPNSNYCKQKQQTNVFGCLLNSNKNIIKTASLKQVRRNTKSEAWFFLDNGSFFIKDKNKITGLTKFRGSWKCDGPKDFIIKTDDGDSYSTKKGDWDSNLNIDTPAPTPTPTVEPVVPVVNKKKTIKLSDIKNGSKSAKIGDKGSIVTKIQDLLIGLGYNDVSVSGKSDGNFGPKTDGMVKKYQKDNGLTDDGVVGAKTIAALLGGKSDATKVEPVVNTTQPDSIQGTDGVIIKEKEKLDILQESVKKLLRKSLLGFRKK